MASRSSPTSSLKTKACRSYGFVMWADRQPKLGTSATTTPRTSSNTGTSSSEWTVSSGLPGGADRKRCSTSESASSRYATRNVTTRRFFSRIVAAIEEQFSRLDAAEVLLGRARSRLRIIRSALLRAAFAGSWPTSRIGDIALVGSGATPKRDKAEYWVDGTIPWVTSGQLTQPFVSEPAALITERALKETNVRLWPKHTLLVALYGEGKTRGHCSELLIEATTNQACAAIVLHDESVNRDYLKLFFAASYEANRQLATGGVQPNLSLGLVKNMRVPRPPSDHQQAIVDRVARELSLVQGLENVLQTAARRSAGLRRSILERAFRGDLVPQDPNDESASALLERIAAERATAERANGHRPRPRATMQKS
jgi:type I restriction enzyme S subunit